MAATNKIIAIDGYSSCGKSTLAKALAGKLRYLYIDSGAMYRAVTLYFIRHAVSIAEEGEVISALERIHVDFHIEPEQTRISLNGGDVSDEIRQVDVAVYVGGGSASGAVRRGIVAE